MMTGYARSPNPFCKAEIKPDWAQLTRLAGDRVAILFEALRKQIGRIEGLEEELYYAGSEWGWVPRYRVGRQVLFIAHVLPGVLEVTLNLETSLREKILASPGVAAKIKEAVRDAPILNATARLRLQLASTQIVRSFANLVLVKSRLVSRSRA